LWSRGGLSSPRFRKNKNENVRTGKSKGRCKTVSRTNNVLTDRKVSDPVEKIFGPQPAGGENRGEGASVFFRAIGSYGVKAKKEEKGLAPLGGVNFRSQQG